MRLSFLHIILVLCCLPGLGLAQAQTSHVGFYVKLGMKDAAHELALTNLNLEDERDFWLDQKQFESLLKEKDPAGYQAYLNGKFEVYREHQLLCGERCTHSDEFARQIAFYLIHGESVGTTEIALELQQPKKN